MSTDPAAQPPDSPEHPIDRRASSVLHFQRLSAVEHLAAKTARQVSVHTAQIGSIDDRVDGLANAHEATLIAVRASTDASGRLSSTLEHVGGRLEHVGGRLDELLTDYGKHVLDNEKEKRRWPTVAVWLWGSSLAFGASMLLWIWSNWGQVSAWLPK
jgi:hypothetical protein